MKTVTGTVMKVGRKRFENCSLLKTDFDDERISAKQTAVTDSSVDDTLHFNGKLGKLFNVCKVSHTLMNNKFITEHIKLRIVSSIHALIAEETAPEKCPKFVGKEAEEMICDIVHGIIEQDTDFHHGDGYFEYSHYDDHGDDDSKENKMSTNRYENMLHGDWARLSEKLDKLEKKFYKSHFERDP